MHVYTVYRALHSTSVLADINPVLKSSNLQHPAMIIIMASTLPLPLPPLPTLPLSLPPPYPLTGVFD